MATPPLAQWMDASSRMTTDMAVPSQGDVPAVDGIAGYPDRSRGVTTGMPTGERTSVRLIARGIGMSMLVVDVLD